MGGEGRAKLTGNPPRSGSDTSCSRQVDRTTIRRLLALTAGVAVGLTVWGPIPGGFDAADSEHWRALANAVVLGLALPAPLFTVRIRRAGARPLGPGGLLALAAGLGAILLMPPVVVEKFDMGGNTGRSLVVSPASSAVLCSFYVFPLMGLWCTLAAALGGQFGRRLFQRETPWTERYGFLLGLLWSPLGLWVLVEIYQEML